MKTRVAELRGIEKPIIQAAMGWINRAGPGPALRALRTDRTTQIEREGSPNILGEFANTQAVYLGGDLEAGIALTGQVAGRIHDVKPVAEIFDETMREFERVAGRIGCYA